MTASPVRISDKLKNEIVNNVHAIYAWFMEDINKQKPDVGDKIYDIIYGPHLLAMERLPTCFYRKSQSFETKHVGERTLTLQFSMTQARYMGYSHPSNEHIELSDYGDKINIKRTPVTAEIVDAILGWQEQRNNNIKTREASTKAVKKVLSAHASLSPAIKMFPPLADLLPANVRIRMEVPQHRLSSVQMELDPDLKRLATDIATKKFLSK